MKIKTLLTFAAAAAMACNIASADDTPLGKEMSGMNKALRALKKQAADPAQKAASLEFVAKMKATIEKSATLEPKQISKIAEADKPAYIAKYKSQMADLGKAVDELSANIEKGDADAIKASFTKLSELKEKGHKDFGADDE